MLESYDGGGGTPRGFSQLCLCAALLNEFLIAIRKSAIVQCLSVSPTEGDWGEENKRARERRRDRKRGRGIRKRRLRRQRKKRRSLFFSCLDILCLVKKKKKKCCLFKVTWPRLHLWFTEPNYFSPRATGSVWVPVEREGGRNEREGGRERERKTQKRVGELVCALPLQLKGPGRTTSALASSPHALLSPPSSWVKLGKFLQRLELHTSGWVWLPGHFLNNAFVCFFFFPPLDFLSLFCYESSKKGKKDIFDCSLSRYRCQP